MASLLLSLRSPLQNKDSYLILDKLPSEYDPRVKAMEVRARGGERESGAEGAGAG
jgi:ATP-dependent 26S proteasome regulatory subunit